MELVASQRFLRRLLRKPMAVACLVYLALVTGVALVAPLVLPEVAGEHAGDLLHAGAGPTAAHVLGTDTLGRDVLARLLVGTRPTMAGILVAVGVVILLGVPLGLVAGYFGGWIDRVIGWVADLAFALPAIVIILVVLAVFPQNVLAAMITLGVIAAPGLMRLVRSAAAPVRTELYVDAARVCGLSAGYILTRHVLPRIIGPVIVQVALLAAVALQVQTGLAFLGLLTPAPAPSWGGMVADATQVLALQPWLIWPPGVAIAITILVLGLLGDTVRDAATETWSSPVHRRPVRVMPAQGPRITPPAPTALLSIRGLSVALDTPDGPVRLLDDVSFDIRRGETIGLVGESGSGKTITAMAVLGLLPGRVYRESGEIFFAGHDLAVGGERVFERVRGARIALVSQEPVIGLNPAFRVGWQLAEAIGRHQGVSRSAARAGALDLLERVSLPDPAAVARSYPHQLSGGMAQRVAIARALAGEPELLIADEPTTALDVTVQAEILDLLRDLQAEQQMAILFVSHDWGVIADICHRAVVMYAGQVVEQAMVEPMFQGPLHPYTQALLAADPHSAPAMQLLPTIPGTVPAPGSWPEGCHFQRRCLYATATCRIRPIALAVPTPDRVTRCAHYDQLRANHQERSGHAQ